MMLLFVAIGLIAGYLRGGRLRMYLQNPLKWLLLPVISFGLKACIPLAQRLPLSPSLWLPPLVIVEYGVLLLFCWINHDRKLPMLLVGIGTLSNLLAHISANFRMPVLRSACNSPVLAGILQSVIQGLRPEYVAVDTSAPLWFLGDCIPITILIPGIASIGDLLLGLGVCLLLQRLMGCKPLFNRKH